MMVSNKMITFVDESDRDSVCESEESVDFTSNSPIGHSSVGIGKKSGLTYSKEDVSVKVDERDGKVKMMGNVIKLRRVVT